MIIAAAQIRVRRVIAGSVMEALVAAVSPTVDVNPQPITAVIEMVGILEACTIAALPIPTKTAAVTGSDESAQRLTMKKEAQARHVTQTGSGIMTPVT